MIALPSSSLEVSGSVDKTLDGADLDRFLLILEVPEVELASKGRDTQLLTVWSELDVDNLVVVSQDIRSGLLSENVVHSDRSVPRARDEDVLYRTVAEAADWTLVTSDDINQVSSLQVPAVNIVRILSSCNDDLV